MKKTIKLLVTLTLFTGLACPMQKHENIEAPKDSCYDRLKTSLSESISDFRWRWKNSHDDELINILKVIPIGCCFTGIGVIFFCAGEYFLLPDTYCFSGLGYNAPIRCLPKEVGVGFQIVGCCGIVYGFCRLLKKGCIDGIVVLKKKEFLKKLKQYCSKKKTKLKED